MNDPQTDFIFSHFHILLQQPPCRSTKLFQVDTKCWGGGGVQIIVKSVEILAISNISDRGIFTLNVCRYI